VSELYIGLMSGTSLDGVDAVLADFSASSPRVLAHASAAMPAALKDELLALNSPTTNELHRAAIAGNALVQIYASQVHRLLEVSGVARDQVKAIGAHGQTVRHRPGELDGMGYTLHPNHPAPLAQLCGIDVAAAVRTPAVAAGGQGAPLVPPFHQAFFGTPSTSVAVLNIGGISNVTLLPADSVATLIGFDCGPGNALMDGWCKTHTGQEFDDLGRWAHGGTVHTELLGQMLREPFFAKASPKSTGRDLFSSVWLTDQLAAWSHLVPQDVQATLAELTAVSCAQAIQASMPQCASLIVCGGGALNKHLMDRFEAALPGLRVTSSAQHGLPPLQVEATAFAWLARQTILRKTGSVQSVTGARGARILGGIYPA